MKILIFKELYIEGFKEKQKCLCCSYSQIDIFLQCSYRWYLSYIKGMRKSGKAEALDLGTAVHITLQDYYNALKDGKKWTLGEAQELLQFNMDMADIQFSDEDAEEEATLQHMDMVKGLVKGDNKLAKLIKGKEIIACEKDFQYKIDLPFEVKYGDEIYTSVYVIGSIDLVLKDLEDGEYIVIDYKSGKKIFEAKKLKTNLQLPIYSMIIKSLYYKLPKKTLYYFTRLDEIQEVEIPALSSESAIITYYKNGNVKYVQRTIDEVINTIIGIFERMYTIGEYKPTDTPLCCWCDYHHRYGDNTCKFGNETFWRKDKKPVRY